MVKISFDIDGVLADFASVAVDKIRSMYVPDLPADYVQRKWDFEDILQPGQWQSVFAAMLQEKCLWQDLPAFEDNVDALAWLVEDLGEENIHMITSRTPCAGGSLEQMTKLWLWEHDLPMLNVHFVSRTTEKAAIIQREGIVWSVDDYWPTIEQCGLIAGHNPRLMNREYNAGVDLPRVHSVAEFLLEASLGD